MSLLIHCSEQFLVTKIVHYLNPRPSKLYNFKPLTKGKTIGLKVSCKVKDYGVLGLDQNFSSYGYFSALVKRGNKEEEEEKEKQEYYVNLGHALRALREDFPALFHRELSFDIYRDDIVLKDPLNTFVGIESYKTIFWALRFHGRMFFKALWIDLSSVWQPAENVIMVRWTVHGISRGPWENRGRFDGTSEYKLDENGKIFQHRVDNIAPNTRPKFEVLRVEELLQSICCPSTARPTCFETSSSTKRT
ncbi:uncharacterized protein LOC114186792 [Vigna unguiculata]|uniref:uncharacterized protein LOC114186792 n=1 Tax=Vigna unguiculata TaxID=3917 RepID=UPI001016A3FF|nr:uncharacterized protein LOC114186792 [Vigna unguiculata]